MGEVRDAGCEPRPDAVRVVYCIQGGGRTSMKSQGLGVNEDVSYTVNAVDVHAVCYGIDLYNQCMTGGVAKSLTNIATDADHIPCVLVLNDQGGRAYIRKNRQH